MAFLLRRPGALIVLGTSAVGGAAYRYAKSPSSFEEASLNPHTFTPYTLVSKQPVSSTSAIFTLRNRDGGPDPEAVREGWKRSVWSVQVKQPQLQIARAYTPLPPNPNTPFTRDAGSQDLRLLIRQEEGGEVSTYIHGLPEESTVEMRGPNIECQLPHDIREVIFLAGGTGIAPAMQVAQALGRRTGGRMHILWANRRREDCVGGRGDDSQMKDIIAGRLGWWKSLFGIHQPETQQILAHGQKGQGKGLLVQELEALKEQYSPQSKGLTIQYYIDEEKTFIKPGDVVKRLGLHREEEEKGSKVILVSGPDGFIDYWAGKKLWRDGREVQGPLGGVLGQMDLKGWSVFKL